MKNTFGQAVSITLFGESHGPAIGAVLDGMASGVVVDEQYIADMLTLRRPAGQISTARQETDPFQILSGVHNGVTTGTPIAIIIPNSDTKSGDYGKMQTIMRPAHADYPAQCKYHGYQDTRGGGHFSGRITAALVAAGAICRKALEQKGIVIGTHLARVAGIDDRAFDNLTEDIAAVNRKAFAVLDDSIAQSMQMEIKAAHSDGDSVGGILETAVIGMPAGVGEPWFDTVEGILSHALFSIPAVKGVEFGDGFTLADMRGSDANDALCYDNGKVVTATNRQGGIGGGITNGMPLCFRVAVKPTPSIAKPQQTVDIANKTDATLEITGRHDPAIVHRARAVVDAMTAITLCDILAVRFGTDWLAEVNS